MVETSNVYVRRDGVEGCTALLQQPDRDQTKVNLRKVTRPKFTESA